MQESPGNVPWQPQSCRSSSQLAPIAARPTHPSQNYLLRQDDRQALKLRRCCVAIPDFQIGKPANICRLQITKIRITQLIRQDGFQFLNCGSRLASVDVDQRPNCRQRIGLNQCSLGVIMIQFAGYFLAAPLSPILAKASAASSFTSSPSLADRAAVAS